MGSIRRRSSTTAASSRPAVYPGDSFESLRQVFHARLESERVHFVTLSAALARADENPIWIFEDLVYRAHRLQGGAAIFEESEVARAAGRLESAANAAAQSRAGNTDEAVWSALQSLVNMMGELEPARAIAHA